jgi:hypothetical protein
MMDPKKRWYDEDPIIAEALNAWESYPHALQVLIADYVNSITKDIKPTTPQTDEFYDGDTMISPKELIALYNAPMKRRWHDIDPVVRSAVNAMSILDLREKVLISKRVLRIKEVLKDQLGAADRLPDDILMAMHAETVDKILRAET